MQQFASLEEDYFYHIYNCGINGENLFKEQINYEHFLKLYDKYIDPIADTYAWCLMPNHFHFLVRIKEKDEIDNPDRVIHPVRVQNTKASQQLSKLFNSYAQSFNKKNNRYGGLFCRPFKRKKITLEEYLKNLVIYIHNNPVHHGFCEHAKEYIWSSYLTCLSIKSTKLKREKVINWFDDKANFKFMHNKKADIVAIEKYLEM